MVADPAVQGLVQILDVLFGRGDDGFPFWLLAVRLNVLSFAACGSVPLLTSIVRTDRSTQRPSDLLWALALTGLAAILSFGLVRNNLGDLGGIGYSRILLGYRGHFGAAQLYSLVYARSARTLEVGILLNRLAAILTVPALYMVCRRLAPSRRYFAVIATLLFCLNPLQLMFSGTEALPACTSFVAVVSYLLLLQCTQTVFDRRWQRWCGAVGAGSGLALLTQIRQENYLLLLPVLPLVAFRRDVRNSAAVIALAVLAGFCGVYVHELLGAGTPFQNPIRLGIMLKEGIGEIVSNPIFALVPLLVGTVGVLLKWRCFAAILAPLPLLIAAALSSVTNTWTHDIARTFINAHALVSIVAGFGFSLLLEGRGVGRVLAFVALAWMIALPFQYRTNLGDRYLETVEHDLFRSAITLLPGTVNRVVVPDDVPLERIAHSTIEAMNKYRMITAAARVSGLELVGATRFLEQPEEFDCSHDNCVLFSGAFCLDLPPYWFARETCAALRQRLGSPIHEIPVRVGSMLDCSVQRVGVREPACELDAAGRRIGFYRLAG